MTNRALLASLILLLAACGSSEAPAPATKPVISPEVAAAPGRLYLTDGRVLPAERWEQDGEVLFYEWKGERQMLLRANVARIEGESRPREIVVGTETRSTLSGIPASGTGAQRFKSCSPMPWVGEPETRLDAWLNCLGQGFERKQNITATTSGVRTQHVISYLDRTLFYIYTSNGTITAVQN